MAIFRGVGGSGDSSDNSFLQEVTAQATAAEASRQAAVSAANATVGFAASANTAASVATTKADSILNLTAATGDAGTDASYNASTGVLTVPRGADGTDASVTVANVTAAGAAMLTGADFTGDVTTTGKVGIGTDNPQSKLHAQGTGTTAIQVTGGASNVAGIYLGTTGSLANGRLSYSNADNSLQLFTNGTERMRIDSSGKVGIGTASPASEVDISKANGGDSALSLTSTGIQRHQIIQKGTGDGGLVFYNQTASAERMRIDSSGNLGIGTDNPTAKLDVLAGADERLLLTTLGTDPFISAVNGANSAYKSLQLNGSDMKLMTGGSERMRIDSTGNLLVGKTGAGFNTGGVELAPAGNINATRTSGESINLNRKSTDGAIANFYKDGSLVGSIGNETNSLVLDVPNNGSALILEGSNTSGTTTRLAMSNAGGSEAFRPFNATSDALFDLGSSTRRFKDLYLSGDIAVGGTVDGVDLSTVVTTTSASFGDDVKVKFGDSDDLLIYHNTDVAAKSVIEDAGTNGLHLKSNGNGIFLTNSLDQNIIAAYITGSSTSFASLFYNNSERFKTIADGVDVSGNIAVSGTVDGRDVAADGTKLDSLKGTLTHNYWDSMQWQQGASRQLTTTLTQYGDTQYVKHVNTTYKTYVDLSLDLVFSGTSGTNDAFGYLAVVAPSPAGETTVNMGTCTTYGTGVSYIAGFSVSGDWTEYLSRYAGLSKNSDGSNAMGVPYKWSYNPNFNLTYIEVSSFGNPPSNGDTIYLHPFDWESSNTVINGETLSIDNSSGSGVNIRRDFKIYLGRFQQRAGYNFQAKENLSSDIVALDTLRMTTTEYEA